MTNREIFVVHASVVDANGTFNNLANYPKTYDTRQYGDDYAKTEQRAYGAFYDALADMSLIDSRQVQIAYIIRVSDAAQLVARAMYGRGDE